MADKTASESDDSPRELIASDVDEQTHAELLCLYRDSEDNIRFAKLLQWRLTGAVLIILFVFGLLAPRHGDVDSLTGILTIASCIAAAAGLCALIILQSWQGTERNKIRVINSRLSSLAREIYAMKLNADIDRYVLLSFMCAIIMIGCFLALARLLRWYSF